ncbi:VapA/VapB family virulence-associated protein [Sphingomonas sp. RB3P16]|uniref:VapA/VapB family virulence-associated protein n=1 Tax=Parasphingomonas frigoris TaxID=3096163 RepID=UPI002FCC4511
MTITDEDLKDVAAGSEAWLRGKIDDAEVDKCVAGIIGSNAAGDETTLTIEAVSENQSVTGVTGTTICVIFYWRVTLETPDGHRYTGNAGGVGSIGGGGIQGGKLWGFPDLNTLYSKAVSFQFNSGAVALNINFFDRDSKLVGSFVGGGLGICLGTGGGSGSWQPS